MKNFSGKLIFLLVTLTLLAFSAQAKFTTVFSDDFESYPNNAALTAAPPTYVANTMTGLNVAPAGQVHSGTQSIADLTCTVAGNITGGIGASYHSNTGDAVILTFWLYDVTGAAPGCNGSATLNGRAGVCFGGYSGGAWASGTLENYVYLGAYHANSTTNYVCRVVYGGSSYQVTSIPRTVGWHEFKIELYNGTAKFYVDNVLGFTDTYTEPAGGWNSVKYGSIAGGPYMDSYLDDVMVQLYTPPRTCGGPYAGLIRVSDKFPPVGAGCDITYVLPFDATSSATINILDSVDTVVATFPGDAKGGMNTVAWDGTVDNAGGADVPMAQGYKVQIAIYNNTADGWYEAAFNSSVWSSGAYGWPGNIFTDFSPNIASAQTKQNSDLFGLIHVPSAYAGSTNATAAMIQFRGDLQPLSGDGFADRVLRQPSEPNGSGAIWGTAILPDSDTFALVGQGTDTIYYTAGKGTDVNAVNADGGYVLLGNPRSGAVLDEDAQLWRYATAGNSVIDKVPINSDAISTSPTVNVMSAASLDLTLYAKDIKFDSQGNLYWVSRDSRMFRWSNAAVKAIKTASDAKLTSDGAQWDITLNAALACKRTMGVGFSCGKVYLLAADASNPTNQVIYEVGEVTNSTIGDKELQASDIVYNPGARKIDGTYCALPGDAVQNFVINNRGWETISLLTPGGETLITTTAPDSQKMDIGYSSVRDWFLF
jgi:hypothetical protein